MPSLNQVTLIGNLTRDPELRYLPNGTAVCGAGLAMNRKWRDETGLEKEEVTFVDFDAWGKTAENLAQYMRKGGLINVVGRLKLEQWDDKQTGQKRSRLKVVAERVLFLGSAQGGGEAGAPAPRPARQPRAAAAPAGEPVAGDGPPESDDVPF